ncbi:MAG TPA: hypothetical protein VKG82_02715 [Solirubrobacteraceae bacterium]|nr:hypothetical protein [Solirubrobacteraceae bacterium]
MIPIPASRLARLIVLALAAAALLMALAGTALARKPACTSSRAPALRRGARACVQSHRRRRTSARRPRRRHRSVGAQSGGSGAAAAREAPTCEDGSRSARTAGGPPTCPDGSEPQCTVDATPIVAGNGSILYCAPSGEASTPFGESCLSELHSRPGCAGAPEQGGSACADGTPASANAEGAFVCDDASEPRCPAGYELTLSEGGTTLVCDVPEEEAG